MRRKRERRSAIANKTGRLFPTIGLLLSHWAQFFLAMGLNTRPAHGTPAYRSRGSASRVGSSPSQSSGAHGAGGDPPLRRPLIPAPAAAGSAGVPSRAALRRGPGPDHSPPQQLRPHGGNQSIPPPPILFLRGLDWLGHAVSGIAGLGPGIASPPARFARLRN